MGMQLQFYIKVQDLQNLLAANPTKVFLDITTIPNEGGPGLVLAGTINGYSDSGTRVQSAVCCPTPCRPFTDANCVDQIDNHLEQIKSTFSDRLL